MSGPPFPLVGTLPTTPWLYVHRLTIHHVDGSAIVPDDEGRFTVDGPTETVDGLLMLAQQRQTVPRGGLGVEEIETQTRQYDAVARFPYGTRVDNSDLISALGIDVTLDGTYEIDRVHDTFVDLRALLVRWEVGEQNA